MEIEALQCIAILLKWMFSEFSLEIISHFSRMNNQFDLNVTVIELPAWRGEIVLYLCANTSRRWQTSYTYLIGI